MKAFFSYLGVALLIAAAICGYSQYVYDGDNFYHLGHAALYWENGPFFRSFPWAAYSVISQHNSDLWWGFHVLLAPLTALKDKTLILAVAPGFLMILNLLISRLAVLRLGMSQWYGLALLPASLGFLTRMDTVRPQVLSSALLVLLFAALITEAPWLAIATAAAIGFLHPTLSYLILMVSFFTILQRGISQKKWTGWTEFACLAVAISVACIRPGITDGLQLLKIQLWDLMMVRRAGEVKNFGVELDKINLGYFNRAFISPVIILVLGVVCLVRFRDKEKSTEATWACFGIVLASFLLSLVITRRGVDQFAPFTVLAALCVFHCCKDLRKFPAIVFALHGAFVVGSFGVQHFQRGHKYNATDYKAVSQWLVEHTQPGEIIGQSIWSDFGPLFYWNRHNRYFGGMDPIFQYRYDKDKYWIMTINCAGRELGSSSKFNPLEEPNKEEPLSTIWPRDMNTRFILCAKGWNDELQKALKSDPNTKIAYEDNNARVYEFVKN